MNTRPGRSQLSRRVTRGDFGCAGRSARGADRLCSIGGNGAGGWRQALIFHIDLPTQHTQTVSVTVICEPARSPRTGTCTDQPKLLAPQAHHRMIYWCPLSLGCADPSMTSYHSVQKGTVLPENTVVLPILSKGHILPSLPGYDRWLCPEDPFEQYISKKKLGRAHM